MKQKQNKRKRFRYLGQLFEPLEKFETQREYDLAFQSCRAIGITNYDSRFRTDGSQFYPSNTPFDLMGAYDYDEFYQTAKKAGLDSFDTYLLNGKRQVIPGTNELFEYCG